MRSHCWLKAGHVAPELVGRGALGRGPHDQPVPLWPNLVQDPAQTSAFVVGKALRDPVGLAVGDQHHEPAGQRHLLGEPGPLGPDGVLGDLAEHRLAGLQELLDAGSPGHAPQPATGRDRRGAARGGGLEVVLVVAHVPPVQDGVLGRSDVDEGGLHAGQHVLDPTQVDVAVDLSGVVRLAGNVVLDQRPSLEDGDLGGNRPRMNHHQIPADRPTLALATPPSLERLLVDIDGIVDQHGFHRAPVARGRPRTLRRRRRPVRSTSSAMPPGKTVPSMTVSGPPARGAGRLAGGRRPGLAGCRRSSAALTAKTPPPGGSSGTAGLGSHLRLRWPGRHRFCRAGRCWLGRDGRHRPGLGHRKGRGR